MTDYVLAVLAYFMLMVGGDTTSAELVIGFNSFCSPDESYQYRKNRAIGGLFLVVGFIAGMRWLILRVKRENDAIYKEPRARRPN